jgi:hypothetical protein
MNVPRRGPRLQWVKPKRTVTLFLRQKSQLNAPLALTAGEVAAGCKTPCCARRALSFVTCAGRRGAGTNPDVSVSGTIR